MPKVSVIIPVFNTEKYLRKCLDSVCNQTLSDIEIICVDDCSTDNSLNILEEYASKDNRIKLIEFKENKGAAVARNTGIKEAEGEYIGFVDSDDFVDLDFYEKLYEKAVETKAEVVRGNILEIINNEKKYVYDGLCKQIELSKLNFNGLFPCAIYKLDLISSNNIFFIENCIYGEDRLFPFKASFLANRLFLVKDCYYNYVKHEHSSSSFSEFSDRKINDFVSSTKLLFCFIEDNCINNEFLNKILDDFIYQTIDILFNNPDNDILFDLIKVLSRKKILIDDVLKKEEEVLLNCIKNKNINKIKKIFVDNSLKNTIIKQLRQKMKENFNAK